MSTKRAAWEDPVEWIVSSCPWKDCSDFESSALQRIRPEDVGYDSAVMPAAVSSSDYTSFTSRTGAVEPSDPLVSSAITSRWFHFTTV